MQPHASVHVKTRPNKLEMQSLLVEGFGISRELENKSQHSSNTYLMHRGMLRRAKLSANLVFMADEF